MTAGQRVIHENADIVALAPYAPRFPFETWLLPRSHGARFEEAPRQVYESLARMLKIGADADEQGARVAAPTI